MYNTIKSKLQKIVLMYATYCKLCLLFLISIKTVLDVCKPLQIMSFNSNPISFIVKYD
ncbi:hypothetical protein Hanom_Chr05g00395201 [Helianthus anomalus]